MHFIAQYSLFLLKTITLAVAILVVIAATAAILSKGKGRATGKLEIKNLNKKYADMAEQLQSEILPKKALKTFLKSQKEAKKSAEAASRRRVFVINFVGDLKASAVENLREEVTAVLSVAKDSDEIVVCLESPGGIVPYYGLATSQLQRIKDKKIPLIICVDKIAASGGYLMSCIADHIIAAPFALIGSIGVVAQLPNFNRLLKKNNIEFEQLTAGEYKRTLTLFGENTDEGRHKVKEDIELIHQQFKEFITRYRPQVDIAQVATGEHWLAERALELKLVDRLMTSDAYLWSASMHADIYEITFCCKKPLTAKLFSKLNSAIEKVLYKHVFN